jgi:hypothetical protein
MIDFLMMEAFDLFNSSSSEPSSTMRISPTVPKTGSKRLRSGTMILNAAVSCLTPHPRINNNITGGILVFEAVRSKMYAISSRAQMVIIMAEVMF